MIAKLLCIKHHLPSFDLDRKSWRATLIGAARATIVQTDGPVVQRAGYGLTENDALRERATFVRAAVEQGKNLVALGAEDGYFAALVTRNAPCPKHRNVFHAADDFPVAHVAPLALRAVPPRGSKRLGNGPAALMP